MAHLVTGHLCRAAANWESLEALPGSLVWTAYSIDGFFAVDVAAARRASRWPFAAMPSYSDLSLELPASTKPLDDVFRFLMTTRSPNSLPRGFLNLNATVSRLLDTEVLSMCADDGEYDFACVSDRGAPRRVRLATESVEIEWAAGAVVARPVYDEDRAGELDEGEGVDRLREFVQGLRVEDAPGERARLHRIAGAEAQRFVASDRVPLGLGDFDGDPAAGATVVARRVLPDDAGKPPPAGKAKRSAWWKLWS